MTPPRLNSRFREALAEAGLADFPQDQWWQRITRHGDHQRWQACLEQLPSLAPESVHLDTGAVTARGLLSGAEATALREGLAGLHPWRKGPFDLYGVQIDTEWRSDLKWDRISPALDALSGRRVLDVGCGSGYHLWRMLGAGARLAVGVEPGVLFNYQFAAVAHCLGAHPAGVLPATLEDLPAGSGNFDTVFSMGVLYHARSPMDHLSRLLGLVRPGGQVVLETLVVEGDETHLLIPETRYARMRNVWFIPSPPMLLRWLRRCGFDDVELVDVTPTTIDEQRSTQWMRFESLSQCLDPDDSSRTIEGYPAPLRAVVTGRSPASSKSSASSRKRKRSLN